MSERVSEDMLQDKSERMSKDMSERMLEDMSNMTERASLQLWQSLSCASFVRVTTGQKECKKMLERMSGKCDAPVFCALCA